MNFSAEALSYHFLNLATTTNYARLKRVYERHQSWHAAWQHTKKEFLIDEDAERRKLEETDCQLILAADANFPSLLSEIHWVPHGIYLKGAPLRGKSKVAIVGTRRATPHGKKIAARFAEALARHDVTVVSGLALGIDGAAHEGALASSGNTVAVFANGVNRIYPREHERLGQKILASHGTLISEYPPGAPSLPHRFIERNRIISGLSHGTLVIEAPEQSGALATARFALEQNREVFIIPGPVDHPNYAGSHALIKDGAALVTEPLDILRTLGIQEPKTQSATLSPHLLATLDETERSVINIIATATAPITVNMITFAVKLDVGEVNRALAFLVVKGMIKENSGNYYSN